MNTQALTLHRGTESRPARHAVIDLTQWPRLLEPPD
jgi:hypothetical protein